MSNWTLFSNHGHVLVCLARDSESRLRDVATDVGITERAVQKIVRDLQDGGMVSVTKKGRRNCYKIHSKQPLRHDLEAHCKLGELINLVHKLRPESEITAKTVSSAPNRVVKEQTKPPLAEPEPVEHTLPPQVTEESSFGKAKADKPEAENPIEKQQGSLF